MTQRRRRAPPARDTPAVSDLGASGSHLKPLRAAHREDIAMTDENDRDDEQGGLGDETTDTGEQDAPTREPETVDAEFELVEISSPEDAGDDAGDDSGQDGDV